MWNTGCNVVYNRTKRLLMIVDGEDPARTLIIEPNNEASFAGIKLPWADRDDEVTRKALRVTTFSNTQGRFLGWFYICQDYRTNAATWVDWRSASPYADSKVNQAEPASYIDVVIDVNEDGEPVVEIVKVT
jgi:hypothetical protein